MSEEEVKTEETVSEATEAAPATETQESAAENTGDKGERTDRAERTERDERGRDGERGDMRRGRRPMRRRRKVCAFCEDDKLVIDFRDVNILKKYISERGKILPRRITGNCAKHQRAITLAVKRARHIALLPYTVE